MAKAAYYDDICRFLRDLKIQDDSTVMYKTAIKLFDLCKITEFMANIEEDAANYIAQAPESFTEEAAADDEIGLGEEIGLDVPATDMSDMTFKIEDFRRALERGQHEYVYHTLV